MSKWDKRQLEPNGTWRGPSIERPTNVIPADEVQTAMDGQRERMQAEIEAVSEEAEHMLAGDYHDALRLADVSVRQIERQASKLLSDADAIDKGSDPKKLAERVRRRAIRITRSIHRPHLIAYRKENANTQTRQQMAKAEQRLAAERARAEHAEQALQRAEERTRVLEEALREEWEMNHAGRCTDLACCKGNGRAPGCYHPMPAALDQETETP